MITPTNAMRRRAVLPLFDRRVHDRASRQYTNAAPHMLAGRYAAKRSASRKPMRSLRGGLRRYQLRLLRLRHCHLRHHCHLRLRCLHHLCRLTLHSSPDACSSRMSGLRMYLQSESNRPTAQPCSGSTRSLRCGLARWLLRGCFRSWLHRRRSCQQQ